MVGFNGKVRCLVTGDERLCKHGDIFKFVNGLTVWNDGSKSLEYRNLEEINAFNLNYKFELVTEEFTKADLKTGMRVKTRNGEMWVVLKDVDMAHYKHQDLIFSGHCGFLCGEFYDVDLKRNDNGGNSQEYYDIIEVFEQPSITDILKLSEHGESIWKRPEPRKMTKQEAEKYISEQLDEAVVIEGL